MARATRTSTMVLAAALATLLLLASAPALATAARTAPAADKASPDEKSSTAAAADVDCEGGAETAEECLARRTLAAHTDYIYTQEHHN
ncbi:phytosulfokines 4 [Brachypodium distachyon]|nr:phytosulfokines 4 [Brachypodium distachyon]|eukprot:XP_003557604.1 phytosulfokines 4 [Brachypodium distachyon]